MCSEERANEKQCCLLFRDYYIKDIKDRQTTHSELPEGADSVQQDGQLPNKQRGQEAVISLYSIY